MRLEEPLGDVDVLLADDDAESGRAQSGEVDDAVDHEQHRTGETCAPHAEPLGTLGEIGHRRSVHCGEFARLALLAGDGQPRLIIERFGREEPEHGVHREHGAVAERTLDLESFDDHAARTGHGGECDVRGQGARSAGQLTDDGAGAVEIAEQQVVIDAGHRAHRRSDPSTWLQRCFEQHGERHGLGTVLVEVPGVVGNVVFADDLQTWLAVVQVTIDPDDATDEVIRLTGQPWRATRSVELRVHRTERLRRFAPRARDHRLPVEGESFGVGGHGDWFDHALPDVGHRTERPGRHEFDTETMRMERGLAVDESEHVTDHRRMGAVPDLLHVQLVGDVVRLRVDLASTLQVERLLGERLETPTIGTGRVTQCGEIERHRLDARLDHEVARHAGVVLEVPVEEPGIARDRGLAAHEAASPRSTRRVELDDLVEEELTTRLDARCAGVGLGPFESGAEALEDTSFTERSHLVDGEAPLGARDGGWIDPCIWAQLATSCFGSPDGSQGVGEFLLREEPGLTVAHREATVAIDRAVVFEEEQSNVAVSGVARDPDLVGERVADGR